MNKNQYPKTNPFIKNKFEVFSEITNRIYNEKEKKREERQKNIEEEEKRRPGANRYSYNRYLLNYENYSIFKDIKINPVIDIEIYFPTYTPTFEEFENVIKDTITRWLKILRIENKHKIDLNSYDFNTTFNIFNYERNRTSVKITFDV